MAPHLCKLWNNSMRNSNSIRRDFIMETVHKKTNVVPASWLHLQFRPVMNSIVVWSCSSLVPLHLWLKVTSVEQYFFVSSWCPGQSKSTRSADCSPNPHSGVGGQVYLYACVKTVLPCSFVAYVLHLNIWCGKDRISSVGYWYVNVVLSLSFTLFELRERVVRLVLRRARSVRAALSPLQSSNIDH